MLEQSLTMLNLRPGLIWVDATAGLGGHLRQILNRAGPTSTVLGIDRDPEAIQLLHSEFGNLVHLSCANYSNVKNILAGYGIGTVTGGILADLGVSSLQLDTQERGFSFLHDGPLDMRMDPEAPVSAATLVNTLPEKELADIIYRFGEERQSRLIARRIVQSRPLTTTRELSSLVSACVVASAKSKKHRSGRYRKDISHPATRTFQALRMAVNDELPGLEKFLKDAIQLLSVGARLVVITFHSLEDRLVKQMFREASLACICPPRQPVCTCRKSRELQILTKKPLTPDSEEIIINPRSRSAKLRAGEKVS